MSSYVFLAPLLDLFLGYVLSLPLEPPAISFLLEPLAPGLPLPFPGFLGWSREDLGTSLSFFYSVSHARDFILSKNTLVGIFNCCSQNLP